MGSSDNSDKNTTVNAHSSLPSKQPERKHDVCTEGRGGFVPLSLRRAEAGDIGCITQFWGTEATLKIQRMML